MAVDITGRFWGLVDLLAPPHVPAWTLGTVRLAQTLRQRALGQRYKLDASVSLASDGAVEIALRIEPAPRVHGLDVPASFARIAEAMDTLGYAGGWDPNPGHAAANGTWRRPLGDLAEAKEEVAFVQGLGAAMEDESQRRPRPKKATTRGALSGWPLVLSLRKTRIGNLSPFATELERSASGVKLQISFLAGTMYKSASKQLAPRDETNASARQAAETAVHAVIGRAKGEWVGDGARMYLVFAPLRDLDAAARFVKETDALE